MATRLKTSPPYREVVRVRRRVLDARAEWKALEADEELEHVCGYLPVDERTPHMVALNTAREVAAARFANAVAAYVALFAEESPTISPTA